MHLDWRAICESPPQGWDVVPFGKIADERRERGVEDLPLLSVTRDGIVPQEETDRRDISNTNKSRYKAVHPHDIAYNTMRMWQGRSAMSEQSGLVSPAYTVITPGPSLNSRFAAYLLRFPPLVRRFKAVSQGMVSDTWSLKYSAFSKIRTAVPPLTEQKRIATILSSVDEAIQTTRAVIEQTRRVKQGLLEVLLTEGIEHSKFNSTAVGKAPESWKVCSLGSVLEDIVAGRSPSASNDLASGEEWGVLKVSAIGAGIFYPDQHKILPPDYEVEERHRVRPGDVLITRANTKELVGASCRVPAGSYRLMLSDKTLRMEPKKDAIRPGFLAKVVNQPRARRYFEVVATGSSGSMKNLSQRKIRDLMIALPPLDEQEAIESRIESVVQSERQHRRTEEALKELKAGLLQDLLTGKVRVKI